MDAALLALNKEQVREREMKDLKTEVRVLKRRRQALTNRENRIQEDVNRGELGPASSYKLPLTVSQVQSEAFSLVEISRYSVL